MPRKADRHEPHQLVNLVHLLLVKFGQWEGRWRVRSGHTSPWLDVVSYCHVWLELLSGSPLHVATLWTEGLCSPKFILWSPNPKWWYLEVGPLEVIRFRGGHEAEIRPYKKRKREQSLLSPCHARAQREGGCVRALKRAFTRNQVCQCLGLPGLPSLQISEKQLCCLNRPV